MQYNINIPALTREAFGRAYVKFYKIPPVSERDQQSDFSIATDEDDLIPVGLLGMPVFSMVDFPEGKYKKEGKEIAYPALQLIDPMITIDLPRNIVKTPISGRDGTVKEYIGDDDYAITIQGILTNEISGPDRLKYPTAKVAALRDLVKLPLSLPVTGRLFELFKIKNIVIQNASWPAVKGMANVQAFELQCVSDEPVELTLR